MEKVKGGAMFRVGQGGMNLKNDRETVGIRLGPGSYYVKKKQYFVDGDYELVDEFDVDEIIKMPFQGTFPFIRTYNLFEEGEVDGGEMVFDSKVGLCDFLDYSSISVSNTFRFSFYLRFAQKFLGQVNLVYDNEEKINVYDSIAGDSPDKYLRFDFDETIPCRYIGIELEPDEKSYLKEFIFRQYCYQETIINGRLLK